VRSKELEWLDTGEYTEQQYRAALEKLGSVGRLLGGNRATFSALQKVEGEVSSLLDVGCGGGHFLAATAERFPRLALKGIDLNPLAVECAQERYPTLSFERLPLEELPDDSFDVVVCNLVCHHISDEELVAFIGQCRRVARRAVIFNDLHRHWLASAFYAVVAPLLFRNRMITHDGAISIRRAFIRSDWTRLLSEVPKYQLSWYFPFRWIVLIYSACHQSPDRLKG